MCKMVVFASFRLCLLNRRELPIFNKLYSENILEFLRLAIIAVHARQ